MSTSIQLPQETTIITQPQVTASVTEITVQRMVYTGNQSSIIIVTDELGTLTVPLTEQQYDGISATLQAILVAHLLAISVP